MKENNNMIINIAIAIFGFVVLAGLTWYFWTDDKIEEQIGEKQDKIEVIREFGNISGYVKDDLNNEQKIELKDILKQREERLIQMREILQNGIDTGEMEDAWIQVQNMRQTCKEKIMPFIAENKKQDFERYCLEEAENMDSDFVQK